MKKVGGSVVWDLNVDFPFWKFTNLSWSTYNLPSCCKVVFYSCHHTHCSHRCNHCCSHCSCQCNHHNGQNSHYHIHCSPWHILRHRWSSLQVNYEVAVCNFPCTEILRAVGHFAIWGIFFPRILYFLVFGSTSMCLLKCETANVMNIHVEGWKCVLKVLVLESRGKFVLKVKVCPRKVNQLMDLFVSLSHLSLISY